MHEVIEILGAKPSDVRKRVKEGQIPYYKPFGKVSLFKVSEIDKSINDSRVSSINELII